MYNNCRRHQCQAAGSCYADPGPTYPREASNSMAGYPVQFPERSERSCSPCRCHSRYCYDCPMSGGGGVEYCCCAQPSYHNRYIEPQPVPPPDRSAESQRPMFIQCPNLGQQGCIAGNQGPMSTSMQQHSLGISLNTINSPMRFVPQAMTLPCQPVCPRLEGCSPCGTPTLPNPTALMRCQGGMTHMPGAM